MPRKGKRQTPLGPGEKKSKPPKQPVSQYAHRIVREAIAMFEASPLAEATICEVAGSNVKSISKWRTCAHTPRASTLDEHLSVIGYKLAIVPIEDHT